jgi:hypothetical protein
VAEDTTRGAWRSAAPKIDGPVAEEWGRMTTIRTTDATDAMLAATAKVHGMRRN